MKSIDTLIIGAGISGLSLAHALVHSLPFKEREPRQVLVAEGQGFVGGNITTGTQEGFLWEEGPLFFSPTPDLLKLMLDVGLEPELLLSDPSLPNYVYWQERVQSIPMGPWAMAKSPLLSPWGKLRAIAGALGFVPPPMGHHLIEQEGEETVAQFFQRHLGVEVMERLVDLLVSGVYAGDANQLSATAAFPKLKQWESVGGGLIAGAVLSHQRQPQVEPEPRLPPKPRLSHTRPNQMGSFRRGLQALPEAISTQLGERVKLNWQLNQLRPTEHQTYIAEFTTPVGAQQIETRTVVLTVPAYVAATLLKPLMPEASQALSATLSAIIYPPVANVALAYPESELSQPLHGVGCLIPRGQGLRTLSTLWGTTLFPDRAPQGWQLLSNFIGGASDPEIADLPAEAIAQIVHQELARMLLRSPPYPPKVLAVRLWRKALPQYTLGHHQRLNLIHQNLKQMPGLYLCSNYLDGLSLGDCVSRAKELSQTIAQYLSVMPHLPYDTSLPIRDTQSI